MSYQRYCIASFGSSKGGLITVGYALYDTDNNPVGTRTTTGIFDLGGGAYGAQVTFDDGFQGRIAWDTGESSPRYANEEINDARIDLTQNVDANDVSAKTTQNVGDCLSAGRADAAGKMVLDVSGKTQTLYGPNNEIIRVFHIDDVNTPTQRT